MNWLFVLGAPDPEMAEIARLAKAAGHAVCHALHNNRRVRSESAYDADNIDGNLPPGAPVVTVECAVLGLTATHVVDHHRPGDPGYAGAPHAYMESSSLGQVLNLLGLKPTLEQRLMAAADHCPSQAYRGECPGVDPQDLRAWRTRTRAQRRGVTEAEMEAAIEQARLRLLQAEKLELCGTEIAWVDSREGEIPEASARYAIPFMYRDVSRSGRTKLGIMGAPPGVIETWMRDCGLHTVYGNPHRGYAGGYTSPLKTSRGARS